MNETSTNTSRHIYNLSSLPVIPQIQVTLNCNLNCQYCFESHHVGIIDFSTVESIVGKVVDHNLKRVGTNQPIQIYWHGGEPLLAGEKFFKKVITLEKTFKGVAFDNRIQTNATLMTDNLAKLFVDNNFSVGFSVDGPEDLHNSQRCFRLHGEGSFAATMRGIECFRSYSDDRQLAVIAVITRKSLDRVADIFNFFKNLIARVQLDIYDIRVGDISSPNLQPSEMSSQAPSPQEIGQFLIELFDLWFMDETGRVDFSELRHEVKLALQPDTDHGNPYHKKRCDFRRLIFDPLGRAFSCDQYVNDEKTALGDILQDSLESIMARKNELWEQIKHHLRQSDTQMACNDCRWGGQCGGGCLTCMKYNVCLLAARRNGLPDHRWHEMPLPTMLDNIQGETYYCKGLGMFRRHVREAVRQELARG